MTMHNDQIPVMPENSETVLPDMPPVEAAAAAAPAVDWQDKALRLAADVENMRKRAAADVHDARAYALTNFARDLLPTVDNFARALAAPAGNEAALREGLVMVQKALDGVLAKHGVAPVKSVGEQLDANLHQAVQQVADSAPTGTITAELQAGYTLNGRLLRPAMVVVSGGK
jgi:molecular chaperone GrpE